MEKYNSTDIGLINSDNANWLFQNNIISQEGYILNNTVIGLRDKRVQLYSYLRFILEDMRSKIPSTPRKVVMGIDEFLTLMREGKIELSYEDGEEELVYRANYPVVVNIEMTGKRIFSETVKSKDKKEVKFDLEGFDFD